MKHRYPLWLTSCWALATLPLPLAAQETPPQTTYGRAVARAAETVEQVNAQPQATDVLDDVPFDAPLPDPVTPTPRPTAAPVVQTSPAAPALALPESVDFAMPDDEMFIEMPGETSTNATMTGENDTISVDFPQEDVRAIIQNVADLYELNVVIPESLVGSVSLKLRNVTWQQVFKVVLEPLAFTYIQEDNIIKIKSQEELLAEPTDTRVFIVNFSQAAEMQASISPLVDAAIGGRIQVDTRSNALVITERPSRMNEIQRIIETLDRPTEQVMIESKFIEVTDRDGSDIGIDWSSLRGFEVSAGPFARNYSDISTFTKDRNRTGNVNETLNVSSDTGTTNSLLESSGSVNNNLFNDVLTRRDTAVFSSETFEVIVNALEESTDVELISNPTIVTMNNTAAEILIGEEFPTPEFVYNEERGTFDIAGFGDPQRIGILLQVTPQVNSAGFITLDVAPEISTRTGEVEFSGAVLPILTTRSAKSTVAIKSGFTLAIGGLIEQNTTNNSNNVPVLGKLPVLGRLFSNDSNRVDVRNLIIFITAKVLSATGATYEDVYSPQKLYQMGINPRDLPGFAYDPVERDLYRDLQQERINVEAKAAEIRLRQQLESLRLETEEVEHSEEKEPRVIRRRFQ